MRKISLLIVITLGLIASAVLVTAGLLIQQVHLFLLAMWITVLLLVLCLGFFFTAYRRIMMRLGIVNERLAEVKLLQERRYEQLARRIDKWTPSSFEKSAIDNDSITECRGLTAGISELEHLNARMQRAEQRILGKLENLLLDSDRQLRVLKELAPNSTQNDQL